MAKQQTKLTDKSINDAINQAHLENPNGARFFLYDTEIKGFALRIYPARRLGVLVFRYVLKGDSQNKRLLTFGTWGDKDPEKTLTKAREWAWKIKSTASAGKNPAKPDIIPGEMSEAEKRIPTLADYIPRYLHRKANRTKPLPPTQATIDGDTGNLKRICETHPDIVAKQLHLITTRDIEEIVNRDDAQTAGNAWLRVLRHLFNRAAADNDTRKGMGGFLLEQSAVLEPDGTQVRWRNPCKGIAQYTEHGREPEISDKQLAGVIKMLHTHLIPSSEADQKAAARVLASSRKWRPFKVTGLEVIDPTTVVHAHDPWFASLIMLQLLTGARGKELRTARWSNLVVGTEKGIREGFIRVMNVKEKGDKRVYLSRVALKAFEAIPKIKGCDWVFPGKNLQKPIGSTSVAAWWDRHRGNVPGLDDIYLGNGRRGPADLHDLRHNFAKVLIDEGASLAQVGEMLGHKSEKTTKRYAGLAEGQKKHLARLSSDAITGKM